VSNFWFLETLTSVHTVHKFCAFYGKLMFNTLFTKARNWIQLHFHGRRAHTPPHQHTRILFF